jgi:hypothetical protein
MQWTGMGKITVPTAGTPVALANSTGPAIKINTLMVSVDPADGAVTVYIKDVNGNIMSAMLGPNATPNTFTSPGGDQLDLRNFKMDVSVSGKGPIVGYGIN